MLFSYINNVVTLRNVFFYLEYYKYNINTSFDRSHQVTTVLFLFINIECKISQNGKKTCAHKIIEYFLYKLQVSKTAVTLKNALYERNMSIYENK